MVNLDLYKIFVVVANELNITKASEKLNISQPAVTKHIKNLENIIGITLFKRSNKGLMLTEAGLELYESLKNPINEIIKVEPRVIMYDNKTLEILSKGVCNTLRISNFLSNNISNFFISVTNLFIIPQSI